MVKDSTTAWYMSDRLYNPRRSKSLGTRKMRRHVTAAFREPVINVAPAAHTTTKTSARRNMSDEHSLRPYPIRASSSCREMVVK